MSAASEFLDTLVASFANLSPRVLLAMLVSIAVIVALPKMWKRWLERWEDWIDAQEERRWDWLEPLKREFERKSNLDAGEDIVIDFAELKRLLAEDKNPPSDAPLPCVEGEPPPLLIRSRRRASTGLQKPASKRSDKRATMRRR
jgi:hypothetical protein